MATKDEVLAAVVEESTQVSDAITALETKIQELIDGQQGASPADLDEILAAVRAIYTPAVVEEPVG